MIDIVIVTYNAKDKLKRCLQSVMRSTKDIPYVITVVNNNSSDGTREFLNVYKAVHGVRIIGTSKNLGFSGGANIALKETENKFIVFLDDDAEVTEGWLGKMYGSIKKNPNVGIVGCRIVFPDNRVFSAEHSLNPFRIIGLGEIDKGQRSYVKECDALVGACWLMRRDMLNKVGYFDERFFPSQAEDIDYCIRTRLAGYKIIYNGEAKVIHHHLFRDDGRLRENMIKFRTKWRKVLRKFPLRDSSQIDKHVVNGIKYIKRGRFENALSEFDEIRNGGGDFFEPFYIGITYEGLGRYRNAIREFRKIPALDPLSVAASYHMSSIYRLIGLEDKVREESLRTVDLLVKHKDSFIKKTRYDSYFFEPREFIETES